VIQLLVAITAYR